MVLLTDENRSWCEAENGRRGLVQLTIRMRDQVMPGSTPHRLESAPMAWPPRPVRSEPFDHTGREEHTSGISAGNCP